MSIANRSKLGLAKPAPETPAVLRPCAAAGPRSAADCLACDIRHLTMCAALDDAELRQLERLVTGIQLEAGQTLFQEGDDARTVYNLTQGTVRVYKMMTDGRRQITGFMLPGDFIGLASRGAYSYGAEAVSPASLCRFDNRDLRRLFDEHPDMEKRLLTLATDELAAAQEQMLLLGRKSPLEKIASFLLTLSRRAERVGRPANPLLLAMSRSDIADYLGLTIETVSRTFTKLKSDGLIALPEPNRVVLSRLDALQDLADGAE